MTKNKPNNFPICDFHEFMDYYFSVNPNASPDLVQDGWILYISNAIKNKTITCDGDIARSNSDIYFGESGTPFWSKSARERRQKLREMD